MIDTKFTAISPVGTPVRAGGSTPLTTSLVAPDPSEQFTPGSTSTPTARPQLSTTTAEPEVKSESTPAPFGPLPIDKRVPMLVEPVASALGKHWDFLYDRTDPARPPVEGTAWCNKQRQATSGGVDHALGRLREKGHQPGTGKCVVLGGGYEVDLKPLLAEFAEVHVVDLTDKPFSIVERQNAQDPNRDRLKFIQTDLSGIDPMVQGVEINRLHAERAAGKERGVQGVKDYVGNLGDLKPSQLDTGGYTMVVAPVLTESMPYGAVVTDIEARRDQENLDLGRDDSANRRATWKHVSSHLPDDFYFDPQVRSGFDRLFLHQSSEIDRLLEPGGVAVTSFWTRPDERQPQLAPNEPEQLHRLGDNAITTSTFDKFFSRFEKTALGGTKIYGDDKPPTVQVFSLEKRVG